MLELELKPDLRRPGLYVLREQKTGSADSLNYRPAIRSHVWRPPTDVFETGDEVVVRVEIAGMEETGFTVVLDVRDLFIRGVRADTSERRAYYQMEIRFGEFGTDVGLPVAGVSGEIQAVYTNGFLNIRLPKAQPQPNKG